MPVLKEQRYVTISMSSRPNYVHSEFQAIQDCVIRLSGEPMLLSKGTDAGNFLEGHSIVKTHKLIEVGSFRI